MSGLELWYAVAVIELHRKNSDGSTTAMVDSGKVITFHSWQNAEEAADRANTYLQVVEDLKHTDQHGVPNKMNTTHERLIAALETHATRLEAALRAATPAPAEVVSIVPMSSDQRHAFILSMRAFGGSFVSAIADAYKVADSSNTERLDQAFPELLTRYGPGTEFYLSVLRGQT